MDQHDQRMECLRMAFELGGKAEPVVSAAQQLLDFVAGKPSAGESRAEPATAAPAASAPEQPAAGGCPADRLGPGYAYNVTMLIGAGAAMAANCEWCLSQAVPNLIEAGVADADIRRAVQIGQSVKDRVSAVMNEAADLMTGTQLSRGLAPEACFVEQTGRSVVCCG